MLVNQPFNSWVKIGDILKNHPKFIYHHDCMQAADVLKDSITNSSSSRIDVISNPNLQQVVCAILFFGEARFSTMW